MHHDPRVVVEAKARFMVKAPFWSVILYDQAKLTTLAEGNSAWSGINCQTAMTDGYNIVLNQDFFAKLSIEERVFVLAHEVYHVMAMHPLRMRKYGNEGLCGLPFLPDLYNICADALINRHLKESQIGVAPKGCVQIDHIGTYQVTGGELPEELYEKMLSFNPQLKQALEQAQKTAEEINAAIAGGIAGDVLSGDVITNSPDQAGVSTVNEASMRAAIATALTQSKAQGTMPAGLKRFIDDFLEPKVRWEDKLRRVIITRGRESTTWNRPNRRRIVFPGYYSPRRMSLRSGDVAVAVDTSGSALWALPQFCGEIASILGDARPNTLHLMWCDARVDEIEEYTEPEELRTAVAVRGAIGGGGTSFIPPFLYVREHEIHVDTMIYLTDGYGPFPAPELAEGFETIWCICNRDVIPPFGTHLVID